MKKLICLMLIAVMLLAAGCGNNEAANTTPGGESKQTETTTQEQTTPTQTTTKEQITTEATTPEPVTTPEQTTESATPEQTTEPATPEQTTEEATTAKPLTDLPNVGDIVTFGSYPQDADGTVKPIEWQVLAVEDGKALLISRYGLDAKPYNEKYVEVTWESCTLRTWLNADFYKEAFSKDEQSKIQLTKVENKDNEVYGTPGGNNTTDKIFLLSLEETLKYFDLTKNNGEKHGDIYCYGDDVCCQPTEWAVEQGCYIGFNGGCVWWLCSPGSNSKSAALVDYLGNVFSDGNIVDDDDYVVRPAFWYNPNP